MPFVLPQSRFADTPDSYALLFLYLSQTFPPRAQLLSFLSAMHPAPVL